MANEPAGYKSGFVSVVGRPNTGKSTLVNTLLGQKVAAVSPRPQTTRRRQLGILSLPSGQVIFVDTPGLHKPVHKLGEYMNDEAISALAGVDVILFVVDAGVDPKEEDALAAARISAAPEKPPTLLLLNKTDLMPEGIPPVRLQAYQDLLPGASLLPVSARTGDNLDKVKTEILTHLPEGEPLYDPEQVTDLFERDIAADLIREAALIHLRDEVPHAMAVRIDGYTERGETGALIQATLVVERESHKPIVIGKGGEMLKKIGTTARRQIEEMSGRKVFLELRVKVQKNWRSSEEDLKQLGFFHQKEE